MIVFCFITLQISIISGVQVYIYDQDSLKKHTRYSLEYTMYKVFSRDYNKYQTDITYIAIPWCDYIKSKSLHLLDKIKDTYDNACTVCQHCDIKKIVPYCKKLGIKTVFTPQATTRLKSSDVTFVPFPFIPDHSGHPYAHKTVLCSFIGALTHNTRKKMSKIYKNDKDIYFKKRRNYHNFMKNSSRRKAYEKEYADMLSMSRFSLCPRGVGPNSVRLWESLKSGAIPIVISDNLILPYGIDWSQCVIHVKEKDVSDIKKILASISKEQEESMRLYGVKVADSFLGEHSIRFILDYFSPDNKIA
jgi:hypothetical protein